MSRLFHVFAMAGVFAGWLHSAAIAQQPATGSPDAALALQDQPSGDPQSQQRSFLRASSLIGLPIHGTDDVRLGVVGDILIDPATYEFRYVLVDTGVGAGTNSLPVIPWILFQSPIGTSINSGMLTVPVTAQRLTRIPTVSVTNAQVLEDASWVASVDEFFATDLLERRVSRPDFNRRNSARPGGRRHRRSTARPETLDADPANPAPR